MVPFISLLLCFVILSINHGNWTHARANRNSGREYAAAGFRCGTADPTVVGLEPVLRHGPRRLHRVNGVPTVLLLDHRAALPNFTAGTS
jgi:hypothetical protein